MASEARRPEGLGFDWEDVQTSLVFAGLASPLGPALRQSILLDLLGIEYASYYEWSRARSHWKELVWPQWLRSDTTVPFEEVQRSVCVQLRSRSPQVREHAAYFVWLLHAIDYLRPDSSLSYLTNALLKIAVESGDSLLRWIAIHVIETYRPELLSANFRQIGHLRHMFGHAPFADWGNNLDMILDEIEECGRSILGSHPSVGDAFRLWELSAGAADAISRRPGSWLQIRGVLEKSRASDVITTPLLLRVAPEESMDGFLASAHPRIVRGRDVVGALRSVLEGRSSHPGTVLRRRVAASMIRLVESPETRLLLSEVALNDPHPFVRLSAISSLRETSTRGGATLLAGVASGVKGKRVDNTVVSVALGASVRLRSNLRMDLCRQLIRHPHPRLRRHAIGGFAETLREQGLAPEEILKRLLMELKERHEFALNLAQCVRAFVGTPIAPMGPDQWGLTTGYRAPL